MHILPAIDLRGGQCVRLRQGDYNQETIFGNDPGSMAKKWAEAGAERLHLVDLDGAKAGEPINLEAVRSIIAAVDIPCQLGGGIRDERSIALMLDEIGVDRVIVGTQALKAKEWFRDMVDKFPRSYLSGDRRSRFHGRHRRLARCLKNIGHRPRCRIRWSRHGSCHLHQHRQRWHDAGGR